jgi:cytochrome c2
MVKNISRRALLIFVFFCCSSAKAEVPQCIYCHLDNVTPVSSYSLEKKVPYSLELQKNCALCHVNLLFTKTNNRDYGWTPHPVEAHKNKFKDDFIYAKNPALRFTIEGNNRFTDCGLRQFLSSPIPRRYKSLNSMLPIKPADIELAIKENKIALDPCVEKKQPTPNLAGENIFKNNCLSCHSDNENTIHGPRLRLGYPLYSKKYFAYRVKNGFIKTDPLDFIYQYQWKEVKKKLVKAKLGPKFLMPAFNKLSKGDLDNLYEYVSFSNEDLSSIKAQVELYNHTDDPDGLFSEVTHNIFETSCRHCHSTSTYGMKLLKEITGVPADKNYDLVQFPVRDRPFTPSAKFSEILSPTKDCGPSPMVKILWERHREIKGSKAMNKPGMPMNLPPVPFNTINQLRKWSNLGCPTPKGFLCKACKK